MAQFPEERHRESADIQDFCSWGAVPGTQREYMRGGVRSVRVVGDRQPALPQIVS